MLMLCMVFSISSKLSRKFGSYGIPSVAVGTKSTGVVIVQVAVGPRSHHCVNEDLNSPAITIRM